MIETGYRNYHRTVDSMSDLPVVFCSGFRDLILKVHSALTYICSEMKKRHDIIASIMKQLFHRGRGTIPLLND
jgi:hypothetical protein